jgi:hypothetical protein
LAAASGASPSGPLAEAEEPLEIKPALGEYKGVWVFVEQTDCVPAEVSWELLSVQTGNSLPSLMA